MAGRLSVGGVVGPMLGYPGPPINQVWLRNLHTCGSNRINGQQLQKCAECPEYHSPPSNAVKYSKVSNALNSAQMK